MDLLVRRREKSIWALNRPKGNQDYLKGRHNGKGFGSDMRNKLMLAEQHVLSRVKKFVPKDVSLYVFLF